jgi:hypothetical protein
VVGFACHVARSKVAIVAFAAPANATLGCFTTGWL